MGCLSSRWLQRFSCDFMFYTFGKAQSYHVLRDLTNHQLIPWVPNRLENSRFLMPFVSNNFRHNLGEVSRLYQVAITSYHNQLFLGHIRLQSSYYIYPSSRNSSAVFPSHAADRPICHCGCSSFELRRLRCLCMAQQANGMGLSQNPPWRAEQASFDREHPGPGLQNQQSQMVNSAHERAKVVHHDLGICGRHEEADICQVSDRSP